MTRKAARSALSPNRKFIMLTSDDGGAVFVRARDIVAVGTKHAEDDDGSVVQHGGQSDECFWVREPVEHVLHLLEAAEGKRRCRRKRRRRRRAGSR